MKKVLFTLFVLFSVWKINGQTIEAEKQNLNLIIQYKTQAEIAQLTSDWKAFLKDYGEFPKLSYNEKNNKIEYQFINSYSLSKEIIFNRIMEWASINFGSLDRVLHYKNLESGKIILKGNFKIIHTRETVNFWGKIKEDIGEKECFQTYVFTINKSRLKIEVINVNIERIQYGYVLGTTYVPESRYKIPIDYLYPVTNYNPLMWQENLTILVAVEREINNFAISLNDYINNFEKDYSF